MGYSFSILPRNTIVQAGLSSNGVGGLESDIAASYSILQILASIFQLLWVTYLLYLHRGDQTIRWGFASFSFVPVPYAIMSLVNGISHLFSPAYPAVYMVASTVMEEAEEAGGSFCGIVGHVKSVTSSDDDTGYGSGIDFNWKGLRPEILYRTALSILNSADGKRRQISRLTVFEQSLAGQAQSADQLTRTNTSDNNADSASTSNYTGLSILLVQQSQTPHRESYIISSERRSDVAVESRAYGLPGVSLQWLILGVLGAVIVLGVFVVNLAVRPKKTYHGVRESLKKRKHRVQTFFARFEAG